MTLSRAAGAALAAGLFALPLFADFSYQETTRITGGAMVSMMKFAGAFSKDARKATEPIQSSISIKGNRLLRKSADMATIIDLDQQTITNIHYADRTYSTVTFEQMRQQLEEMSAKMKQSGPAPGADASFDIKVNDTHQHRTIDGQDAHEMILTFLMNAKDQKSGATGGLEMTTDMWIAPGVPGYDEVRDFHRRMATKLNWFPGANPLINRPDMMKAMSEMYGEASKLDGMPLESIVRMGGHMEGVPADNGGDTSARQQTRQPSSVPPTSVSGALAGALGGRFGLGRRKKHDETAETTETTTSTTTTTTTTSQTTSAAGSLMEMTSSVTGHSTAPVNAAVFDVPAGFNKIEEDLNNRSRRRR